LSRSRSRSASPLAACVLAVACGAAPGSSSAPSPAPTEAAAAGPRAVLPSGAVYRLELATVPEDQAQGLMYRENLPEHTGMLFLFAELAPHHFWMKNTMIPLDIVWLDESGKVLFVSANTPPCKADPCPTYGSDQPVRMVLELAGGMAAKERVEPGSVVVLKDLPR
jgi:uncharacterized membrane protein (UPF0127 family)